MDLVPPDLLQPHILAAIFGLTLTGAALQGSLGYGLALVVSPLLLLIDPRFIPGPVNIAALALSLMVLLREKHSVDLRGLKWAIVGRIPGTLLAGWLLVIASQDSLALMFAILLLLGVAFSLSGRRFPPSPRNLTLAGLLSGVMGTIATIGGPPVALVYQDAAGDSVRPTLASYFIFGGLISLATYLAIGKFGLTELALGGLLLPGVVSGYLLSTLILPRLNSRWLRNGILAVAAASGLFVIAQQVFQH